MILTCKPCLPWALVGQIAIWLEYLITVFPSVACLAPIFLVTPQTLPLFGYCLRDVNVNVQTNTLRGVPASPVYLLPGLLYLCLLC